MLALLRTIGWIVCVIYSTIPTFWLLVHPCAQFWRSRPASPYKILLPLWIGMWAAVAAITAPWHGFILYTSRWMWFLAAALFCGGLILYRLSHRNFSLAQLGGLPEVLPGHSYQRLVTTGIRARVRHPVYLGHLCQMLAWSVGTGLAVCWVLTSVTMITGAIMIKMEDEELEKRFGEEYKEYRRRVAAVFFFGRGRA